MIPKPLEVTRPSKCMNCTSALKPDTEDGLLFCSACIRKFRYGVDNLVANRSERQEANHRREGNG